MRFLSFIQSKLLQRIRNTKETTIIIILCVSKQKDQVLGPVLKIFWDNNNPPCCHSNQANRSMYLIPLENDIVYYNDTTFDASSLAAIVLLAVAYHPTYNNLLYLLYGCTSFALPGSTYGNINIMIRDMAAKQFLQNSTISQSIECIISCEIQVTENLFLIQSQSYIAIYRLNPDQQVDVGSPIVSQIKQATTLITGITRQAGIYKNKYIISTVESSTLGEALTNNAVTQFNVSTSFMNSTNILAVGMTEKWSFQVVNSTNVSIVLYYCGASCLFDGSFGNYSNVSRVVLPTSTAITYNYRFYQGITTSEGNISNAFIFVGIGNGVTRKFYVNQTTYQLASVSTNRFQPYSTGNSMQYIIYGSALINRYFAYSTADQNMQLFSFNDLVELVTISEDSSVLAVSTGSNDWNVKEYQIVSDCAQYATNITNTTQSTGFCSCYQYSSNNFCKQIDTSTGSSSGSFPIVAVIGVVIGVVAVAVSVMVVKKNYKKCQKRHRTPWKYNPVELMSFQV